MGIIVGDNSRTYAYVRNEFSEAHYDLPKQCAMFDVDSLHLSISADLICDKGDKMYLEYRTEWNTGDVSFIAMFELKSNMNEYVDKFMRLSIGGQSYAQVKMCERLGCRYFVVIGTNGLPPFTFYEWDFENNSWSDALILNYSPNDRKLRMNEFWKYLRLM